MRLAIRVFLGGILLAFLPIGCAWTIRPPAAVSDPTTVYLTEYKRHTRLALPSPDPKDGWVEYGFGEWNYYGLENRSNFSGLRAITGLGTAARSRRQIRASKDEAEFLVLSGGNFTAPIQVDRKSAESLQKQLETEWAALQDSSTVRRKDGVPVSISPDETYHLFHNSNHATALWLRDLDCDVDGTPILSNFQVRE